MELHFLRDFIVLAETLNYYRAAENLNTTQPTLTRHIKALEEELGYPLFIRTTRKVEISEFGKQFMAYAKKIVSVMNECEANLLSNGPEHDSCLRVGVFGQIANYPLIHDGLKRFCERFPHCAISATQGDIKQLKEKLLKQEYSLAITRERYPTSDEKFLCLTIQEEPLCVVLPKDDPIAQGEFADINAIEGRRVTVPSEHMLSYKLFMELCGANGFEPQVNLLLKEREFMEGYLSLGNGITVLSKTMAECSVDHKTQIVKEIYPRTCEYVNLLVLKKTRISEIVQCAFDCFEEAVRAGSASIESQ